MHGIKWSKVVFKFQKCKTICWHCGSVVGSVYAVMHFFQLWMLFLGTIAYNAMFFATIKWMNGFVFAISAAFLIPSILFLL